MPSFFTPEQERAHRLFNGPQRDPTAAAARHGFTYHSRRQRHGKPLMPDDFMPVGPHTGKHLRAIDPLYFAWVQSQPWAARWADWAPVADCLSRHPSLLPQPSTDRRPPPIPHPTFYISALQPCQRSATWKWEQIARLHALPGELDWLHTFAIGALGLRIPWFDDHAQPPSYALSPTKHALAIQHTCVVLADPEHIDFHARRWSLARPLSTQQKDAGFLQPNRRRTPFERLSPKSDKYCLTTKAQYTAQQAADLVKERHANPREKARPDFLRAYECRHCGHWHLTRNTVA